MSNPISTSLALSPQIWCEVWQFSKKEDIKVFLTWTCCDAAPSTICQALHISTSFVAGITCISESMSHCKWPHCSRPAGMKHNWILTHICKTTVLSPTQIAPTFLANKMKQQYKTPTLLNTSYWSWLKKSPFVAHQICLSLQLKSSVTFVSDECSTNISSFWTNYVPIVYLQVFTSYHWKMITNLHEATQMSKHFHVQIVNWRHQLYQNQESYLSKLVDQSSFHSEDTHLCLHLCNKNDNCT